ncbi:uncharacterized protein LOC126738545 [Anthonomus grandis grandis]|uniref:uncharacterized protein LOC126738545 n=1 Tax=Anthonomus grandis grandis TaxID=2921223 RepID=UPI002165108B|nr:uncharacterized protein LOC126738545 [Anthonomus grandis grandis]
MEDQKEYKFIGYFPEENQDNQLDEQEPPISWLACIDHAELQNMKRSIPNQSVQELQLGAPLKTAVDNPAEISQYIHIGVQSKKLFNNKIRVNQEFPEYVGYYRPYCTCFIPSPESVNTEHASNRRMKKYEENHRTRLKRSSRNEYSPDTRPDRSPERIRTNKRRRSYTPEDTRASRLPKV